METGHRIQHIVEERSDLDRIYFPESVLIWPPIQRNTFYNHNHSFITPSQQ